LEAADRAGRGLRLERRRYLEALGLREPRRLRALLARDLVLVGAHEMPAAHDGVAADVEPVDAVRAREHEAGDGITGARQLEAVHAPDGDVGALARLERADVVAAEHRRASARAHAQGLARRHGLGPAAAAGDEQRLLDLEHE